MTKDCPLNYKFSTWKVQSQNMGRTCCVYKLFWMSKQKTIHVQHMFSSCSELAIFMYWTRKSMNNLSSYYGLVDAKIRTPGKDLPVCGAGTYIWACIGISGQQFLLVTAMVCWWRHLLLGCDTIGSTCRRRDSVVGVSISLIFVITALKIIYIFLIYKKI